MGSTIIVKAQSASHQALILAEMERVQHFYASAMETLEVTAMQGTHTARRERQVLLSVRALHERYEMLRSIAFLGWEHLQGGRDNEAELMALCGCAPSG